MGASPCFVAAVPRSGAKGAYPFKEISLKIEWLKLYSFDIQIGAKSIKWKRNIKMARFKSVFAAFFSVPLLLSALAHPVLAQAPDDSVEGLFGRSADALLLPESPNTCTFSKAVNIYSMDIPSGKTVTANSMDISSGKTVTAKCNGVSYERTLIGSGKAHNFMARTTEKGTTTEWASLAGGQGDFGPGVREEVTLKSKRGDRAVGTGVVREKIGTPEAMTISIGLRSDGFGGYDWFYNTKAEVPESAQTLLTRNNERLLKLAKAAQAAEVSNP